MDPSTDLVSPKQVARAIGVSESSLKRWCDQGLIKTVRTAGGHRKMAVSDVLRFIRANGQSVIAPEVLGLPSGSNRANANLAQCAHQLMEALVTGDEGRAGRIVYDLYLANHSLSVVFDEVIATAFHRIGDRWACNEVDVYQERRGCEIAMRILSDLRRRQVPPAGGNCAIGGAIEGDTYTLPSAMAEIVLRESGFHATSLGTSIPFASLIRSVNEIRPKLFWLSISHIHSPQSFLTAFAKLSDCCNTAGTALIVGGRALTEELRKRMSYSAFCDNMQHLEAFARTLQRSLAESVLTQS